MQSVMQHDFSSTPRADIPRSSFDRSHTHKTSFNSGLIIPVYADEALPGDTFKMNMSAFARMSTPIYPLMDNLHMDVHFFSVPNRQIWTNWRKFMGEQTDPGDSIDYTVPQSSLICTEGSFEDYLGIPLTAGVAISFSDLYQRAYHHIYNEWFRDQNLQDSTTVLNGDAGATTAHPLLPRGKRHDYFTSALPWPQKGDASLIPLGTTADVLGIGPATQTYAGTTDFYQADGSQYTADDTKTGGLVYREHPDNAGYPGISVDLTNAASSTVNELRQAFQIQKLLERDARGGTRYAEIIDSHFNVQFLDVTYRPEYLGGGTIPININPVAQTSSTDATTPQGNLSAFATAGGSGIGFTKSFTEHCIVMGFVSVRADLTYQAGINKAFLRQTRYDYYWPALAHIGEQAIEGQEIFWQPLPGNTDPWGYQERYAEYRYKPSMITGSLRSTAAAPLDAWHLSQEFTSKPVLGSTFIEEDLPMSRVLAVTTQDEFIFDSYFDLKCTRPMPMFGVPGMMDRF